MKVTPIEAALLDEIDRERARGTRFVMVILVISLLALASLALMFSSAWSEREQERAGAAGHQSSPRKGSGAPNR